MASSACSFASYLATLGPAAPVPSPGDSTSTTSSSSIDGCSPSKRARAHSPDTSIASTSPLDDDPSPFFSKTDSCATLTALSVATPTAEVPPHLAAAAATTATFAQPCVIRSILCATFSPSTTDTDSSSSAFSLLSSPSTSPPLSRPLSRRSSTGASTKSVRFARCTNASVFPALSGEEYDRTPIVPTCEAESLELPKRKRGEAEGWIKCVERERAAAAKRASTSCAPKVSTTSSLENPVEGVHGLIEGGYFVGEERDESSADDHLLAMDDDPMMVDDEETGEDHHPALIQDDSSGDDSEAELPPALDLDFTSSPTTFIDVKEHVLSLASVEAVILEESTIIERIPRSRTASPAVVLEEAEEKEEVDDDEDADEETEEQRLAREKKERCQRTKERYGLCALGKYTRAEVFSSYDSLGGF